MNNPSIEEIKALDGKIFAMLSGREKEVLDFYRDQGRKFGVSLSIINKTEPEKLARATSKEHADQIMMTANSVVSVSVIVYVGPSEGGKEVFTKEALTAHTDESGNFRVPD